MRSRLEPGDVIATGTPGGVGIFRDPPVLLDDGDEVAVEIEGIGRLVNTCRFERVAVGERMSGGAERFLVTGALGCIGAWTVRALVREGAQVTAFDLGRRCPPPAPDHDRRRARARHASRSATSPTSASLERVIDRHGITNVIHLAALQVPFCRADPPRGALVNVVGTVNVFEAVTAPRRAHGAGRLHELDRRSTPPTTPIR